MKNNQNKRLPRVAQYGRVSSRSRPQKRALERYFGEGKEYWEMNVRGRGFAFIRYREKPGVKGWKPLADRPKLMQLLEFLSKGDVVLVTSIDRLARNEAILHEIRKSVQQKGATLVSLKPSERTEVGMKRGALKAERHNYRRQKPAHEVAPNDVTNEQRRVRQIDAALASLNPRGPKCFEDDIANKGAVELIHRLHGQGMSSRKIAERLDAKGHVPPKGGRWCHTTISRYLKRRQRRTGK